MSIFGDYFLSQVSGGQQPQPTSPLSTLAAAQYRPTPAATFPNPAMPAPGPSPLAIPPAMPPIFLPPPASLPIPPAQPPIFLSPPPAAADASAAPAQPANPWDSIVTGINHHALTLMALGAGIAQGGVGRGLAAAATAAEGERNRQAQQLSLLQTYKALTDGGVPPQEAQAAIANPSLMRAVAAKYLGPRSPGNASSAPSAVQGATQFSPAAPMRTAATAPENGPYTFPNPFDFSHTDLQGNYLWNN